MDSTAQLWEVLWFAGSVAAFAILLYNLIQNRKDWRAAMTKGTGLQRTLARGALTAQWVRLGGIVPSLVFSFRAVLVPSADPNHIMTFNELTFVLTLLGLLLTVTLSGYMESWTRVFLNVQQECDDG